MHERRLASLDLLRGFAAFSVAVPHYFVLSGVSAEKFEVVSVLAVEVFFVLSGYVLSAQIVHCVQGRAWRNVGTFLMRRWMRTVPPYLFALLVISLVSSKLLDADFFRYGFYAQNLFFQANTHDYYPVAWSLSVEEWFYVTFPVLAFACLKRARADLPGCVGVALGFVATIALLRLLLADGASWGEGVRRVVAFRIDAIAYGFLLHAATTRFLPLARVGGLNRWVPAALLLCAASGTIAFHGVSSIALAGSHLSQQLFPFYAAAFGSSVVLLFYTLVPAIDRVPVLAVLSSYLGKVSYSVYLFHIIIGQMLRPQAADLPMPHQLAIYLGATLAFSTLFYGSFERPILAARPRYRSHAETRSEEAYGSIDEQASSRA